MLREHGGSAIGKCISRRAFIRLAGAAMAGALVAACAPSAPSAPPGPELAPVVPTAPQPIEATAPPPQAPSRLPLVAIGQADSYDRALVAERVRDLLDGLGGLGGVVRAGDRIAIKVNLTGGTQVETLPGVSAIDSFATHPEVVRALGGLLRDAGARELYIVEAVYEWASYTDWGYEEVANDIGATLVDLNAPAPFSEFATVPVGDGALVYPHFTMNPLLIDVDVFVSVSKMKHHWSCGVTHALKNSIGLAPARFYRLKTDHNYRSAMHGEEHEARTRLARVIVDLNRARPIHLALVDGIKTVEGGEGPWIETMRAVEPGLLVAGIDPVATDAVATALMGHDPTADYPTTPFNHGDNHLVLAHQLGLGVGRLAGIQTTGPAIEDVRYPFDPGWA